MKTTLISLLATVTLIGGVIAFIGYNNSTTNLPDGDNVTIVNGQQIIDINAKGGYFPKVITAKAETPTTIKVLTSGTFDCSSVLNIPSLGYQKNLPPSGETLIDVPPQKSGAVVQGVCGMGMYNFKINFN